MFLFVALKDCDELETSARDIRQSAICGVKMTGESTNTLRGPQSHVELTAPFNEPNHSDLRNCWLTSIRPHTVDLARTPKMPTGNLGRAF